VSTVQHRSLAEGRWQALSLVQQLANIGSEVERALDWLRKNNREYSRAAFLRALELLDMTVADPRHLSRLKEIVRLREVMLDYFLGDNRYRSTEESWRSYFRTFAFAAALEREKSGGRPSGSFRESGAGSASARDQRNWKGSST